jgi:HAD superfamily hydrolase (TIGR01549 family)
MAITTVIFDWDLTLAYSLYPEATIHDRILRLFNDAGIDCNREAYDAARAGIVRDTENGRLRINPYPQKKSQILQNYRELLRRLGRADVDEAQIYRIYSSYATLPSFLYPDVAPLLDELQARGLQLGVLSNHSRTARPVIERMVGRWIAPTRITISEEEGVHKPRKTIFRRARQRMGAPAAEIAYVGDNLRVDAVGSVENGGYAAGIWLDRHEKWGGAPLPTGVRRIENLAELPQIIE